ncbi:MAG: phenylalanine--tRNA ligase subunit beta [Eggerthellaceae bacterium]|nr:phenylalanine--tRNA ligase subunit beta [Eggerthellaceae bacterium]
MKLSTKWISDYVEVPKDMNEFCDRLDLTGTSVGGVKRLGNNFDKIVTAQVVKKEAHPDSDHLWICQVDVGEDENLNIVCGAQNFEEGDHVVTAKVGAVLPGDFKIKKSKLRGVKSCGMNCSQHELGLGDDHEGILILEDDAPIGMPIAQYLQLSDTVIDLEITPNRPDCLSIEGLAREIGVMYSKPVVDVRSDLYKKKVEPIKPFEEEKISIEIEDPERCQRYSARMIRGVKVGPSPAWLYERVTALGARSINNIVDITNYILFLFGQPLHAFDVDSLFEPCEKPHIIVRPARQGENFTTLDEEKRMLNEDITVIATPSRPVALAGVMGGLDSEVTDSTTNILLETATFSPGHTNRTSRNLGLISESSMRYERRVDDCDIDRLSDIAAALIVEVAGGKVFANNDLWLEKSTGCHLKFDVARFCNFIGKVIAEDEVKNTLEHLGCKISGSNVLDVHSPTFRPDLVREVDLYEEVLRIHGVDKVESTLPKGRDSKSSLTLERSVTSKIHTALRASCLSETMTFSFYGSQDASQLGFSEELLGHAVELSNPMSQDQSIMRQSIVPNLLKNVQYNISRNVNNIALYEGGVVFRAGTEGSKPKELECIAGVLSGSMHDQFWNVDEKIFDFFDIKGVVENLLDHLNVKKISFKEADSKKYGQMQPGRCAEVYSEGNLLGWLGEIHPKTLDVLCIEQSVCAFELDKKALVSAYNPTKEVKEIGIFPAAKMDVAFVLDKHISYEHISNVINSEGGKLLESARLFDYFEDEEKLDAGKKSMAFRLTYRALDHTISSKELEKIHSCLVKKVCRALKAELR